MKEESNLEPRSRYCKYCKDHFWNHIDCDSIRKVGGCSFCFKEGKIKVEINKNSNE